MEVCQVTLFITTIFTESKKFSMIHHAPKGANEEIKTRFFLIRYIGDTHRLKR